MGSNTNHSPPNWSNVEEEVAKTILSQGETYLKAQMQFALDADKRALTLATGCITFSTALFAAALVVYNNNISQYIVWSLGVTSIWVLIAAYFCFFAARPVPFALPGSRPALWWDVAGESPVSLIGGETENYQERIETNSTFLNKNSRYVRIAMIMFALSPLVFGATYYIKSGLGVSGIKTYICESSPIQH
ncbi:hypothetical protein [Methylobacterium sp. WCS2018Hpa-22]|uniref:hypothetical protein n=1 Tax=Methylobacterium sp. WCS2018Hpa-22 TaxID=3073633 RepID=UPI00288A2EEA|nr:hypothetical protein [Methylobacterium sp. WCS2018Hpa-22]